MSTHHLAEPDSPPAPVILSEGRHAPDDPSPLGPSDSLATIDGETRHYRHDGWTPPARAAFLDTLAVSGIVTDACKEVKRSSQAAYALRNRDALFAAGWDAALSMARARLTDELLHRAVNGTVEQLWKDGAIVAERHRHDSRLSIAMLNRLDARADRAERTGAPSLRAAAQWDAYLAALAEDRVADAEALIAPPAAPAHPILGQGSESMLIHQLHQLRLGKALDADEDFDAGDDEGDEEDTQRVWVENHSWRTNFPPPEDFNGHADGVYGEEEYNRQCTPEEWAVLDRAFPNALVDLRAEAHRADEAERVAWFAALAAEEEPESAEEEPESAKAPAALVGDAPEPAETPVAPTAGSG